MVTTEIFYFDSFYLFCLGAYVFSAFYIIVQGFLYQERVFQVVNVLFYSVFFIVAPCAD